jgi:hypothetical protein
MAVAGHSRQSGTLVGLLDLLDERLLRPGEAATLASLLLDHSAHGVVQGGGGGGTAGAWGGVGTSTPLPDWQHEPAAFAAELQSMAASGGRGWDARTRSVHLLPLWFICAVRCTRCGAGLPPPPLPPPHMCSVDGVKLRSACNGLCLALRQPAPLVDAEGLMRAMRRAGWAHGRGPLGSSSSAVLGLLAVLALALALAMMLGGESTIYT